MAFIGGGNRSKRLRGAPLAALDVGTSKICCLISRVDADNRIRLRGVGQHISRGLRAGTVVDIEAAQLAIAQAVASAEEMAGETIRQVYVNVSGGRPASEIADVDLRLDGRAFGDADWRAILRKARDEQIGSGRALVHAIATNFSIDGAIGIQDPRGMVGEQASAKVHMVTAQASALRNLRACLAGCHIEIAGIAVSPYAAGLACLHDDEMNLGVTVVDMGAGTTSIASFFDGKLVFASTVPFGGSHVTSDIAHGVGASLEGAERVKALHGCAQGSPSDVLEIIDVPQQLDDDGERRIGKVPKSVLVGMMRPRLEEILEAVDERLKASGLNKTAGSS
jgi:cell division protein FtsA